MITPGNRMRALWMAAVGATLALTATAFADAEPWQVGVSDEQRARAQAALDQGNALYVQNLYKEALEAYERGLAEWNHPAIRFNVAKTLIVLDRPLEALAALELAMQHGDRPLVDVWSEAVNYRSLLASRIATLTLACAQDGVAITVDGEPQPRCPSETTVRVLPGRRSLVARRDGYLPLTRDVVLVGGDAERVEIELVSLRDATVTRTRWATWKPWAVAGGGALTAGLGALLVLDARGTVDDYRRALDEECGERGCAGGQPSAATRALLDDARLRDRVGISLAVAGGVGLATGIALLVANRPYTEVPSTQLDALVVPGGVGVTVTARR